MQPSLLLTVLLAQGAGSLSAPHPSDADLYLELPDPAGLVQAMRAAPLMDTLRDEEVVQFVGSLTGAGAFDLDAVLDDAWQNQIPGEFRTPMEGLEGLSLSLRVKADGPPDLLVVAAFADAATAAAVLESIAAQSGATTLDDAAWPAALALPDDTGMEPWVTARGAQVLFASASHRDEALAARLAGEEQGIASHAMYARADAALPEAPAPTLVHGFFRRSPVTLLAELAMTIPGAPLEQLGLVADLDLGGGAHRFRMGFAENRYVTEIFSPRTELSSAAREVLGVAPVDPSRAAALATGGMLAYATTVDGAALGAQVRAGLQLFGAQMGQPELPAAIEAELGFPVERLFAHLGQQMTLQTQPIAGPALPETAIWFDLADAERFVADLDVIVEKLPGLLPGFEASTRDYRVRNVEGDRIAYPITTLSLPPGLLDLGLPFDLQPSPGITVANGRLLMGLSSVHVKRELKRLVGDEPPAADETNPWAQSGFELPAGARSAVFVDWGRQISGLVSLAKVLGPMAGDELPVDLSTLPGGETFVKHFRPTVHFQVQQEDGTYRLHEASFGPETWFLPFLAFQSATPVMAPDASVTPLAPAAEGLDREVQVELALQKTRAALAVYRADRGEYPASLDDLLSTSQDFPQGYLADGRVPADPWGNALVYAKTDEGFELHSTGPNGLDESGGGDDISLSR